MRTTLPALALAFAALGGAAPVLSQSNAPAPLPMQFGQRVQLGPMMGERTVREVMISQGGGGIDIVYDMPAGAPQSKRVLRLENVNGMLEVIYDSAMPEQKPLASGGTPRLIAKGGGMYEVTYDR